MILKIKTIEVKFSPDPVPYGDAIDFMEMKVKEIAEGKTGAILWFLEHPSVVTIGTSGCREEILDHTIDVYQTGRGGRATYHGPGQRVIYLMLPLKNLYKTDKPDLRKFITDLEKWIIASLAEVGIEAFLVDGMVGVWVLDLAKKLAKIAAIGIRVSKWVSYHGVAINLDPDLMQFKKIIPCGIKDFGVTSMKALASDITMLDFDKILLQKFKEIFCEEVFL